MAKAKTAWMLHIEDTMKQFPQKSFKEVLVLAGKTYKKAKSVVSGVGKAVRKTARKALRMRGGESVDPEADASKPMVTEQVGPVEPPVVSGSPSDSGAEPHTTEQTSSAPSDAAQAGDATAPSADSKPADDAAAAPAAQQGGRKHRSRKHHKLAKRSHNSRRRHHRKH